MGETIMSCGGIRQKKVVPWTSLPIALVYYMPVWVQRTVTLKA